MEHQPVIISLLHPGTNKRIKKAVIGCNCSHNSAFDLEEFKRSNEITCPLCRKSLKNAQGITELKRARLISTILKAVKHQPKVVAVKLWPNEDWAPLSADMKPVVIELNLTKSSAPIVYDLDLTQPKPQQAPSQPAAQQPTPQEAECAVCYSAPPSHAFVPCGHFVCCAECADQTFQTRKKCIICNEPISQILKLFH